MLAFIGHLGLDDFDLGGYSLGGKLVLRLLARSARPAHAVVGVQGLDALDAESDRTAWHRRMLAAVAYGTVLPAGSPEEAVADWIRQSGVDARAVGLVLDTFVTAPPGALRPVSAPTLIIVGDQDSRRTSADSLAALLPYGRLVRAPGRPRHGPWCPEFTTAVLEFLGRSLPANAPRFPGITARAAIGCSADSAHQKRPCRPASDQAQAVGYQPVSARRG
jgi:pimeloyl-ACP methyl ester carboxylesterase